MKAIVIGAGEVGFDVARILSMEQHDVIVIDIDPDALAQVQERLDVLTLQGNGTSATVLQDAGAATADMLIAVTAIDEVNLVACMLADRLGVQTTVARVRSGELSRTQTVLKTSDFGIDLVIHPEESAAAEVVQLIRRASATDVLTFCDGRLHLVGMRLDPDAPVLGKTLRELAEEHPNLTFRVMAIARGIRTILPGGNERLQKNDQVFVLTWPKFIPHVARIMGKSDTRIQHVMVLGGTQVGAKIALQLSQSKGKRLKLIEPDRDVAQRLAEELADVLVIHGDATDIDLLVREGLGEMDAFVAVTDDEESNLVTCLMAKHLGVQKTVAMLSKSAYIPISQSIGLDAAVSKKLAVSRQILRFLRGKHVLSVATVHGLDAEVLELEVSPRSPATRKPIKDLSLPRGVLIGAVLHKDRAEVATGHTEIAPGDRVIVFVLPQSISKVEAYFGR
ncbi:Trk system potassium transport protein TrkA [Rhodothermaceae bacterium RA]|nr:Trk system potassium transport protein TrkA [Rhodothermaceae bacterium RA]